MKESRQSTCFFCSLGCGLIINKGESRVHYQPAAAHSLEFDYDNPVNNGSLCGKCNYIFELFQHPRRMTGAVVRNDSNSENQKSDDAACLLTGKLKTILDRHGPESIGILLSPNLTNEEAEASVKMAGFLGTPHIDYCALEDKPVLARFLDNGMEVRNTVSPDEIDRMETLFIIGDLFSTSPVLSKRFLKAKYEQRNNKLIVLESSNSHTSWFADVKLSANPGTESLVLMGIIKLLMENGRSSVNFPDRAGVSAELSSLDIQEIASVSSVSADQMGKAAQLLARDAKSIIAMASGFGFYDRADIVMSMCRMLAQISDSSVMTALAGANSRGIHEILTASRQKGGMSASQIIESAGSGAIKGILNLGVDILRTFPSEITLKALSNLELLASTTVFPNDTTALSDVVIPAALWLENSGTVVNMFGTEQTLSPVMPPPNDVKTVCETLELISSLMPERAPKSPDSGKNAKSEIEWKTDTAADIREAKKLIEVYKEISALQDTMTLLPYSEFAHSGDGSVSQFLTWSRSVCPRPGAIISKHSNGASSGASFIKIKSNGGETVFPLIKGNRPREGTIAVPHHFREVRNLFPWEYIEGLNYLNVKPARVSIEYL